MTKRLELSSDFQAQLQRKQLLEQMEKAGMSKRRLVVERCCALRDPAGEILFCVFVASLQTGSLTPTLLSVFASLPSGSSLRAGRRHDVLGIRPLARSPRRYEL